MRVKLSDFYKPFQKQEIFHRSPAKYRLFGGAAGPGKTTALLWEAVYQALETPKSDSLLLRRTFPELEGSLLREFRRGVPQALYKKFDESKHVVTWHNGSTIRFGHCRNDKELQEYQGPEYLFIGFDELTHFTLSQWQFLTSRNRCPVPNSFPCMAGASNPGNIGHAWVKALWIDHVAPGTFEKPHLYKPSDYDFIQAKLDDNPIYANDEAYRATLEILPAHLRKAFLEGDWSVFAGQYFDNFDVGRHTGQVDAIKDWWPVWISVDWGFQHPSAVYWHTKSDEGKIYTFTPPGCRELVQSALSPRMLAQAVTERSGKLKIDKVYLSPDAFAHRTAESSVAEQLGDVLAQNGLPRPEPADDDRIGGWQLLYGLLQKDGWACSSNCKALIECIPNLVVDERNKEDIAKVDGDDPADALRYGLYSHLRPGTLPMDEKITLRVEKAEIHDPTSEMIWRSKWEQQEKNKTKPVHFGRQWRRRPAYR